MINNMDDLNAKLEKLKTFVLREQGKRDKLLETDIEFLIELDELRGKANAEFYVINSTEDMIIKTKPELSRGGGVVDIISLALRIAFLQIHKPRIEGPLILDEPAKHLSEEYVYKTNL